MELPQEQGIKKQVPERLDKEQQPLLELSGTVDEIDNVIVELDGANLTPEQQSRLTIIKGNVIDSIRKFSRVMRSVAVTGAVFGSVILGAGIINHEMTHPDLQEITDQSGETIYNHPDERTTHYLNILAGRDKFTDEDVERIGRKFWKGILKTSGLPLPANIGKMSSLEMDTLILKNPEINSDSEQAERMAQNAVTQFNQNTARELNGRVEFRSSTNRDMYGLVWQLEKESGNPRIRFKGEERIGFSLTSSEDAYSAVRNTIYVNVDSLVEGSGIIAEMSHGKQFRDNPLRSHLLHLRDAVKVLLKGGFSKKGIGEAYTELYDTPGSQEYQAHKIIQPYLEDKYLMPYFKQQKDRNSK